MGRSSAPEELLLRAPRSAAVLFFFLPALGVALLVFFAAASPPPAKSLFIVPLGPQRSAAAQRVGVASLYVGTNAIFFIQNDKSKKCEI